MKTLLFLVLVSLSLPRLAVAQQPFAYSISGHIGQVSAPARVYMREGRQLLDSAEVRNGYFMLRGTSLVPKRVLLWLLPAGKIPPGYRGTDYVLGDYRTIFIEPAPVLLTGTDLEHASLQGGPVNRDYQRFLMQQQALYANVHHAILAQHAEGHYYDSLAWQRARQFIRANPASWVSLDILLSRFMGPARYDKVAPLYAALSPALRNSEPGRAYGELVTQLREVALGTLAPDFTLPTATGKPISLQAYRGRYVLLDFWTVSCDACRGERAYTLAVYRKYANRNFTVLSISLDDEAHRRQWLHATQDNPVDWPQVIDARGFDHSEVARRYHLESLGFSSSKIQNFLLDPTGRIIAADVFGSDLDAY